VLLDPVLPDVPAPVLPDPVEPDVPAPAVPLPVPPDLVVPELVLPEPVAPEPVTLLLPVVEPAEVRVPVTSTRCPLCEERSCEPAWRM